MLASRLDPLPHRFVCGHEVPIAVGFRARLLGLAMLGRDEAGPGLLIPHCASIHTFGMRFPLEVFFLDGEDGVMARAVVPPRRFAGCRGAAAVLEVPARTWPG
jgi:uncharacterized protein